MENAEMWALCLRRPRWLPAPPPCQFPCRLASPRAAPGRAVATSSRGTDCPKASVHCRPVPSASYAASRHGGGLGREESLLGLGGGGGPGPASATLCLPGPQGHGPGVLAWAAVVPVNWVGPTVRALLPSQSFKWVTCRLWAQASLERFVPPGAGKPRSLLGNGVASRSLI